MKSTHIKLAVAAAVTAACLSIGTTTEAASKGAGLVPTPTEQVIRVCRKCGPVLHVASPK